MTDDTETHTRIDPTQFEHGLHHCLSLIEDEAGKALRTSAKLVEDLLEMQRRLEEIERELINVQPHIRQLPEKDQPFIDSHVDSALRIIRKVL